MFKKTIIIFAALAATTVLNAQQALWDGAQVESPVLNEDGTVTFRYFAPKAVKVTVSGDFLPTQKIQTPFGEFDGPGVAELKEGEKGVWEYTTDFRPAPEMSPRRLFAHKRVHRSWWKSGSLYESGRASRYGLESVV